MTPRNKVIDDFGDEWERFNYFDKGEMELLREQFKRYIAPLPDEFLDSPTKVIADFGAGTGRWSYFLKNYASKMYVLEPSRKAFEVAKKNLSDDPRVVLLNQTIESNDIQDGCLDLAISLGVLHHVENTAGSIKDIYRKVKPGGLFLGYLYYALDNKPLIYRLIWKFSDFIRRVVSRLPGFAKKIVADLIALSIYLPLAKVSRIFSYFGISTINFPLHHYERLSFYVMRNDALDRFGTSLEQRFSQEEIVEMLFSAGFSSIEFSENEPYWTFVAKKKL